MADDDPGKAPPVSSGTPLPGDDAPHPQISLDHAAQPRRSPPIVSSFAPGSLLANRFRVIRFLARGGMGEVYEAEDLELKERVALKTICFEIGNSNWAIERFRREIQLARKVTNPNVCRTFDVFRHVETSASGVAKETLFVSMELLPGVTLASRIRQVGRFASKDALSIVVQMASGLRAAHLAGVVHRDFKSANVILVPSENSPGGTRVVITDFGLARAEAFEGQSLTGSNDLVGTPAYMAPEQLEGKAITPATDVYALGVVMFEMTTGELPFVGDTGLATALKRLNGPAPSPRNFVPDLDPRWERGIMRCLEREPANRFANVEDLPRALGGDAIALPWRSPKKRTMLRVAAAGVLLLLFLTTIGYFAVRYRVQVSSSRPSVAVLGFKNLSGDPDVNLWGDELAENLGSQLDTDKIHFISSGRVNEMKRDLGLREVSDSLSPAALARIHDYLGCDIVVLGSYSVATKQNQREIVWNIHLMRASDGESLGTVPETMKESERLDVARRAGQQVRAKLGVELAAAEEFRIEAAMPANNEALKFYTQGRERLEDFDVLSAIKLFEEAVAADPNYAEAHSALAEAWSDLGYDAKATDSAKKAFDRSTGLSQESGGLIRARYYEMAHDWDKASTLYSSLWNLFAETPEYGLLLARSQIGGGRAKEALATLSDLRTRALPAGIQAQVDLAASDAHGKLGNYKDQLGAATSAADKAQSLGGKLLLARARIPQCLAMLNLGMTDQAKPICEEARRLNQATGDQLGTARAINAIANTLQARGDNAQALSLYKQALQISRSIGDKFDEAGALNNIAVIQDTIGDHVAAEWAYNDSIAVARTRGDKNGLALTQQNLAGDLYEQGDLKGATDMYGHAIVIAREVGAKDTEAHALNNLCMIFFTQGDLQKALKACRDSLQLRQEMGAKADIANSLVNTGDILLAQENFPAAKQNYDQALKIQQELQAKGDAAYSQVSLARLALQDGRAADAVSLAENAAAELSTENDKSDEAQARVVLAEARLISGNLTDAQTQLDLARQLAAQASESDLRISVAIVGAKIDVQSGQIERALATLASARKDAQTAGLVEAEFEATLALGEAEIKAGNLVAGHSLLRTLAQRAKAKGFNLIATKAARNN
jgi:serine/threonine protein kinase/tetratricopeptide (TPR) repeat protein